MKKTASYEKGVSLFFILVLLLALVYEAGGYLIRYLSSIFPAVQPYEAHFSQALILIVAGGGGYATARMLIRTFDRWINHKGDLKPESRFLHTALSIFLYGIVVAVILFVLHVNLTGLLVGGAVGGVIIGLAVQTIASNLFAGLLVSGSNTINVGDVIQFHSGTIGGNLIGTVRKVTVLFTYVEDINGMLVKLPNSSFLNTTTFTSLERGRAINYQYTVSLNDDVRSGKLIDEVRSRLIGNKNESDLIDLQMFLFSKSGVTNTYSVIMSFRKPGMFNEIINSVNQTIEQAYYELKPQ